LYDDVESFEDMPKLVLHQVVHFFEHYKDLEHGKWVKVRGWGGVQAAIEEIMGGVKRYGDDLPARR
jgi:inorganic pyrophosphatase